jgi:HD-GYP domain-containing protein (c-di-GMP phosphodiesterase class II)
MSSTLYATAAAIGRTSRSAQTAVLGQAVAGGIVLATPACVAAWPDAGRAGCTWVVLGAGALPDGFRPFLVLPAGARREVVDRAVDAAVEVSELRAGAQARLADAASAKARQLELARVGIALTAERDLDTLLSLILTTARELVGADAGSLYLIEQTDDAPLLRFVLAQNDSVAAPLVTSAVPLDSSSLAGYVAISGEPVSVDDAHRLPAERPYRLNLSFDQATGYFTRSVLTTPMATRAGEVIGVLQLINRKTDPGARILDENSADEFVLPFGPDEIAVLRALAAQAAVAIENTRLVQEIERLFEGFVRAAVTAIEQRDPSTSGHSLRVAHYTVSLAHALEQDPPRRFSGVRFSRDEMTQLRYAALLHDFGKVGVREAVLTKAKKLFPERMAVIHERFRYARRARETALLREFVQRLGHLGRAPQPEDLEALDEAVRAAVGVIDLHLAAVLQANEPTVLESTTAHLLTQVSGERYLDEYGHQLPFLLPEELRALTVPKGSLDEEERREMESHVVHSYQFLLTLPWPKRYAQVPHIAYGHHEKLNGRGYPNRLVAEQIPTEVRMMTVSDIYDALAASDRPYKRAVSPDRALAILEEESKAGFLDPDLVRLFIDARIFARPLADPLAV